MVLGLGLVGWLLCPRCGVDTRSFQLDLEMEFQVQGLGFRV